MKTKKIILVTLIGVGFLTLSLNIKAGSLEPANSPAPTMHTLEELYTRVKQLVPEDWKTIPTESQVTTASSIHMTIVGDNQGNIPGSCAASGKESTIRCVGWEHRVYLQYSNGQIMSADRHEPITIIKYIDKATVNLYRAMCQGERLNEIEIKFYRINAQGQDQYYYKVFLEDAYIVEMREITPNLESITFLYGRITWKWVPDNIQHMENPYGL